MKKLTTGYSVIRYEYDAQKKKYFFKDYVGDVQIGKIVSSNNLSYNYITSREEAQELASMARKMIPDNQKIKVEKAPIESVQMCSVVRYEQKTNKIWFFKDYVVGIENGKIKVRKAFRDSYVLQKEEAQELAKKARKLLSDNQKIKVEKEWMAWIDKNSKVLLK